MIPLRILGFIAALAILLAAPTVFAYDVLLDIDLDGDPATINYETDEESAVVWLCLWPDEPGELITEIDFGLGGTCWDCFELDNIFTYGTQWDLPIGPGWLDENPLFASSDWNGLTCWNCCGNPGYHHIFLASAAGGGFNLEAPIFLRSFNAWYSDSWEFEHCPHPPCDLMTFPGVFTGPAGDGNTIWLGEHIPIAQGHWGALKSLY